MTYYCYDTDVNQFADIRVLDARPGEDPIDIYYEDSALSTTWTPVVFHSFADNLKPEGDFPSVNNYSKLPVMSQRAWDALRPLIDYCCEALPIMHPSGKPYFIVHVMETIDALNEEKSELTRNATTGRVNWVGRYSLRESLIKGKHIFKLPLESGGDLLVDEEFRKVVESNGLKGLIFKPLPMVGEVEPVHESEPTETCAPKAKTARPLTAEEEREVRGQIEHAKQILEIQPGSTLDDIQQSIYAEINRIRANHADCDEEMLTNMALGLGCLWGQCVCDRLGWRWASITVEEGELIGIVSGSRSLGVFPMHYVKKLVNDPQRDQTSLLLYNMLKDGTDYETILENSYMILG